MLISIAFTGNQRFKSNGQFNGLIACVQPTHGTGRAILRALGAPILELLL